MARRQKEKRIELWSMAVLTCPRCEGPLYDIDGPDPVTEGPLCLLLDPTHYECTLCDCKPSDLDSCFAFPRVIPEAGATPTQRADAKRSCSERRRSIGEASRRAEVNSTQEMNWLVDAARIVKLVADGSADLAPMFWIRLYGILHEIHARLTNLVQVAVESGARPSPLFAAFLAEVVALSALFSEDELIYVQYRRDTECHPIQNAYEFKINGTGRTRDQAAIKMLGTRKPLTLAELNSAVRRVLLSASSEVELARLMAQRSWTNVAAVRDKGALLYRPF